MKSSYTIVTIIFSYSAMSHSTLKHSMSVCVTVCVRASMRVREKTWVELGLMHSYDST